MSRETQKAIELTAKKVKAARAAREVAYAEFQASNQQTDKLRTAWGEASRTVEHLASEFEQQMSQLREEMLK